MTIPTSSTGSSEPLERLRRRGEKPGARYFISTAGYLRFLAATRTSGERPRYSLKPGNTPSSTAHTISPGLLTMVRPRPARRPTRTRPPSIPVLTTRRTEYGIQARGTGNSSDPGTGLSEAGTIVTGSRPMWILVLTAIACLPALTGERQLISNPVWKRWELPTTR